jgi:hypothetical protein
MGEKRVFVVVAFVVVVHSAICCISRPAFPTKPKQTEDNTSEKNFPNEKNFSEPNENENSLSFFH